MDRQALAELLMNRLALLDPADRIWLEMHLRYNATFRQVAQMKGCSEQAAARQLRQLTRRLLAEDYVEIQRNAADFTPAELAVAYDRLLLGSSVAAIARKRRLTAYTVRKIDRRLGAWLAGRQAVG
jgi:hypothetical protein